MSDTLLAMLDDRLRAQRQDFDSIPVIDISGIRDGSDRETAARGMNWALANTGFMYVKGHGVPEALIDSTFAAARDFFALPDAVKMPLHITKSGQALRGYTELFGENTNPGVTRDFKECFDIGIEYEGLTGPFHGRNQWPDLPGFKDTLSAYLDAMLATARTVLEGIAVSLDLPHDYFARKMTQPVMIQRLLHYPSQAGQIDESMIGIGAHTDYGLMTILAQDDVGGLQVMNRAGQWVEASPIPGTFVVNISDLVQRLTNDAYLANLHRVVNTSGRQRYSMPCFVDCDIDAVIEPLPSCVTEAAPLAYAPVQCGMHKMSRYAATFPHLAAE